MCRSHRAIYSTLRIPTAIIFQIVAVAEQIKKPQRGLFNLLPLVDEFRTLNWLAIKRDLDFSMFSMAFAIQELQN